MNGRTIEPMVRQWRGDRQQRSASTGTQGRARRLGDVMLVFMMGLAIFRGSQIWFAYPTAQNEFVSGGTARDSAMLYLLLACASLYSLIFWREVLQRIVASNVALLVFYAFAIVSVVFSVQPASSAVALLGVAALAAPVLLFRWRFGEAGALAIVRRYLLVFLVLNLLYSLAMPHYAIMTGSLAGDWRGLFPHKNGFGHSMSFIAILLMPTFSPRTIRDPWTWAFAAGAGLAVVFAVLSHSSTALLQIVVGLMALAMTEYVRRLETGLLRTLMLTVVMLLLLTLLFLAGSGVLALVAESFGKDTTFSGRSYIWAALLPHLLDYPMTGHGFGMFRSATYIRQFLASVPFEINSPHSTYIELGLNIGLVGAAAWVLFVLGRVFAKIIWVPATAAARAASARSAAVLVMILIGSGTEAGQMLSTRFALVFLMLALPLDTVLTRPAERGGTPPCRSAGERSAPST